MKGVDAVVHLAGENVGEPRWTDERKRRILESREQGTTLIANEVARAKDGPKTLVQASAIGFYGDRGEEELDESSRPGDGFLPEVAQRWEAAGADVLDGVRRVCLRFGVILTPAGGALSRMLPPFRAGAGGPIGSGRQWMSWVSIDDAIGAIHRALWDAQLEGPVNVVAPQPVRNADFGKVLGSVLRRPCGPAAARLRRARRLRRGRRRAAARQPTRLPDQVDPVRVPLRRPGPPRRV